MQRRQGREQADPSALLKKELKIKTGTYSRLRKEVHMYEREVKEQEEKIAKMKEEQKDEADIRKQVEILEESRNMIPDAQTRLEQAKAALSEKIQSIQEQEKGAIQDSEEWRTACEAISASSGTA